MIGVEEIYEASNLLNNKKIPLENRAMWDGEKITLNINPQVISIPVVDCGSFKFCVKISTVGKYKKPECFGILTEHQDK